MEQRTAGEWGLLKKAKMEQPQKIIEVIGRELQETCVRMDELQAKMDDVFNRAKTEFNKLAEVLIDLAKKDENHDAETTD